MSPAGVSGSGAGSATGSGVGAGAGMATGAGAGVGAGAGAGAGAGSTAGGATDGITASVVAPVASHVSSPTSALTDGPTPGRHWLGAGGLVGAPPSTTRSTRWTTSVSARSWPLTSHSQRWYFSWSSSLSGAPGSRRSSVRAICEPKPAARRRA